MSFWRNKKVLVTGHEGFVGSSLSRALVKSGARVFGVDKTVRKELSVLSDVRKKIKCFKADVSSIATVKRIINSEKPFIVFHLAAEAIVNESKKNPLETLKSNIEGTWNILEACRSKKSVQGIIVASSDKAYGPSEELPYTEQTPLEGLNLYDASKSCADILARSYHRTYGLPVSVLRCGNIYGPGDYNFSRLIPDAIRCAIKEKILIVRSDGTYTRDYIFVDDVVNGYMTLAESMGRKKLYGEPFNLSSGERFTVLGVYEKIADSLGKRVRPPKILDAAYGEIKDQHLSYEKAKKSFRWKPRYNFEEGIKKTISWYRKHL